MYCTFSFFFFLTAFFLAAEKSSAAAFDRPGAVTLDATAGATV